MSFKFDPNQKFQQDAISSLVDLFEGQPSDADKLYAKFEVRLGDLGALDMAYEIGAIGNNLLIDHDAVLANLQAVQDRNGLEIARSLANDELDFDVEMETGTGKTYVYLRTIFELAKKYNFTKFIILVPSVAIKEGLTTSIKDMREHFQELYAIPFDSTVYSGKSAEDVQPFATSTNVQILVMTIDSVRGDKNTRVMYQDRNQLLGLRPIDYLAATKPIVIMDEPQNMESDLSAAAIKDLNPLCTLRFSATHRKTRNVVYRLDPVDAHELGLVKDIIVADVLQEGADATPYIKLLDVKRDPWAAKLELACRMADGSIQRKTKTVKVGQDLAVVTGNPAYENNWRINEVAIEPHSIELTNHGILRVGETIGGSSDLIGREMIRETIREHLRKEVRYRGQGMKILSLFFIDKVANYRTTGADGTLEDGQFAKWFDELFIEERAKDPAFSELLPQHPSELRSAYFAQRSGVPVDSTERGSANDADAYDLIMRDKSRLLDPDEPVRFIFSHSALREGWDNPNVFQICTLREMGQTVERRQTIGRGLRLPVAKVDGEYVRIKDRGVAQLTVIANESYADFAKHLQEDYQKAGVSMGFVRKGEFSKLVVTENNEERRLGTLRSEQIWNHLQTSGFIDAEGRVLANFTPNLTGFTLKLPDEFAELEDDVIQTIESCKIEKFVKSAKKRVARKLNKQLYVTEEFEEFWRAISAKTTYRVSVDRDAIIAECVKLIKKEDQIKPLRIQVTKAGIKIQRGGAHTSELGQREKLVAGSYDLPDIVGELQEVTSLTRKSIIDILIQSGRLKEFIENPNDFIQMVKRVILGVLAASVIDGIQYEKISGSIYELRELQKDGEEERDRFLDQMYAVKNTDKTDFETIVVESEPEREFAKLLDSREDIKMFMKLPAKFKVPTPVGDYNPDWAIVKQVDGQDRIYMIRETKSTSRNDLLRPSEVAKIACGAKHFAAIGITDYSKATPENWNL